MNKITFIGGAEEIGANSLILELDGINIAVDCGLHPKLKDRNNLFPNYESVKDIDVNYLFITHAHTDHLAALPYFIKFFPKSKVLATYETRDLAELVLKDSSKHIIRENSFDLSEEVLDQYKPDILSNIWKLIEPIKFNQSLLINKKNYLINEQLESKGNINKNPSYLKAKLFWSGHILGSTGIYLEYKHKEYKHKENKQFETKNEKAKNILITGDMNLENQFMVGKAQFPNHHIDTLVVEATNCSSDNFINLNENINTFSKFINKVSNENGSILIPAFALGKTQEVLKLLHNLMFQNKIPNLPIYTAGLGKKISKIYDRYCYADYMLRKGFEVSDINQNHIDYDNLTSGEFMKKPSIVIASNGMLAKGTLSYNLTKEWLKKKNFGIAFVGYQEENMPGYKILNSKIGDELELNGSKFKRFCHIEKFRFSAHSNLEQTLKLISELKPNRIFIHHGDEDACNNLALEIFKLEINTKVIIPIKNKCYDL